VQAEQTVLKARVAELMGEADQEEKVALRKENADHEKQRDRYTEEARAAKKQVEELKSKALQ